MRAVIFDLDGTLVDSLDDITNALNHVLAERGYQTHGRAVVERFVGDGARMLIRRAIPDGAPEDEVLAAFRTHYLAHALDRTRPFPGVPELLDALRTRAVPTAVLSNKPHESVVEVVRALFPEHRFSAVLGQRDGCPPKPDPTGAKRIGPQLGVEPIAMVGDSPVDMKTALAAGMVPVAVSWGMRPATMLRAAGAQHLIHHPADLLPLLPN